jgi:hypothetical protein
MIQRIKCWLGWHTYNVSRLRTVKVYDNHYLFINYCTCCGHQERFWNTTKEIEGL